MRLLITGATGYLGSSLIESLDVQMFDEVIIIGNSPPESNIQSTFHEANILDTDRLEDISKKVGKIDTIIHLAAAVPQNPEQDKLQKMVDINVQGTINILNTFKGKGLHFILGSTAEVYGLGPFEGLISEDETLNPISYYGASKAAIEILSRVFCLRNDMDITILRFSVMYGKKDPIKRAIPNFIEQAISNKPISVFGGEELRDYLHIDDAVQAIISAIKIGTTGVFNIGTGTGSSVMQAAKEIIAATKSESTIDILPREKPAADIVLNCEKLQSELGFSPKYKFPEGLDRQIAWHNHK